MSEVFLVPAVHGEDPATTRRKVEALWRRAGFDRVFRRNDLAAVKLHVGEPGTRSYTPPAIAAALVRLIAATGARPFLTDTAVLYRSPRDNAVDHARVAHAHGFTIEAVGAPFVAADGLNGSEEAEVVVDGKHFREVAIATGILHARSLLVLTHATGHIGTGLGGTLKNLGMGCCSKKAKLRQHHGQQPRIAPETCIACGVCAQWCPSDAILVEAHARIDGARCIGCGECIAVCVEGAVQFDWAIMGRALQERIVEHAAAVVRGKPGRIAYVTVAQRITKDCDCLGVDQPPLLDDIGILASHDPVALDQAVLDLVEARTGKGLEALSHPRQDATIQLEYAEAMGLGERRVEWVELGEEATP